MALFSVLSLLISLPIAPCFQYGIPYGLDVIPQCSGKELHAMDAEPASVAQPHVQFLHGATARADHEAASPDGASS
jgi:hypothetical protein